MTTANLLNSNSALNSQSEKVQRHGLPLDTKGMAFGSMTPILASLLPESEDKKDEVRRELVNAGYYEPHAWHNMAATRYLGIIVPIIACLVLLVVMPSRLELPLMAAIVFLPILGWSVPRLIVRSQASNRLSEMEHGLPDMLDMLNMCVSQGLSLLPSMTRVSRELKDVYPALSKELSIVVEQADLGTTEQALKNFAKRVDLPEVHSFTSLLIQTEQMGTNVADALIDYSDNIRASLQQRADERANSAAFKLLFPTVLCLMPAVYLFLLGPAIIELSEFFYGGGYEAVEAGASAARDFSR